MKISLWRQFSSNHSASFIIVGRFPTAEATKDAATELRRIVDSLHAWWLTQPKEEWYAIFDSLRAAHQLTPPEQDLKAQYNLENFTETLDWTYLASGDRFITTSRDLVILNQSFYDNWSGEKPFDEILRQLGAAVSIRSELRDMGIATTFKWATPSQEVTDLVLREMQFERSRTTWRYHAPGSISLEEINDYRRKGIPLPGGEERESVSYYPRFPNAKLWGDTFIMNKKGFELQGVDLLFDEEGPEVVLEQIIAYLESLGCINITYEFIQY